MLELDQFRLQVRHRPEQSSIEKLPPNGADQLLNERMGQWHVRNGFDFGHSEDSKIGLPLREAIQRVMIGAQVFGQTVTPNCLLEHAAQPRAVGDAAMDAEPHDLTRKLVQHDQNAFASLPTRSETDRNSTDCPWRGREKRAKRDRSPPIPGGSERLEYVAPHPCQPRPRKPRQPAEQFEGSPNPGSSVSFPPQRR